MDSKRFDAIAQRLAKAASRRATFRAVAAAAIAPALAKAGLEAEAAPGAERCVDLGDKCEKKKKGQKADKCCGNGTCKGGRCKCGNGEQECNGRCIPDDRCCENNQGECVVKVTPSELNGWVNQLTSNAYLPVAFVDGPGDPPRGAGSIRFAVDGQNASRVSMLYPPAEGTLISDITELKYSTYKVDGSGTGVVVPALKLQTTGVVTDSGTFTTFIFEPVYSEGATVEQEVWQTWDALGGAARWWSSRDIPDPENVGEFLMCNPNGGNATTPECAGKLYVPVETMMEAAGVGELNAAGLQIETGSGSPDADGNADAVIFNGTIFNFEPDAQG